MSDVFVFGVGRSGTTMMYCLLQSMLGHYYPDRCHFTYEPYIWNPDLFTGLYAEMRGLFGKTASLSVSGIYANAKTPLFLRGCWKPGVLKQIFYHRFEPRTDEKLHLVKFVRGSGRMRLFRDLNPDAKFILMIRNPLDVVNSLKGKFSFFGDDFYPSDFPRFCNELDAAGGTTFTTAAPSWAERQAEYCYQMNRAALAYASNDPTTLVIDYDLIAGEWGALARRICDHLNLPVSPDWSEQLATPSGPTTNRIALSESERTALERYAHLHEALCRSSVLAQARPAEDVIASYRGRCTEADYDPAYDGQVTNPLRRTIRGQERKIRELEQALEETRATQAAASKS